MHTSYRSSVAYVCRLCNCARHSTSNLNSADVTHAAPELVKQSVEKGLRNAPLPVSFKGDIYALGCILYQIVHRLPLVESVDKTGACSDAQSYSNGNLSAHVLQVLIGARSSELGLHFPMNVTADVKKLNKAIGLMLHPVAQARPTLPEVRNLLDDFLSQGYVEHKCNENVCVYLPENKKVLLTT